MSKLAVLDVEAQESDQKLFAVLHRVTAECAAPYFRTKIQSFAARELAADFTQEAALLKHFLVQEDSSPAEDNEGHFSALQAQLGDFLRAPLSEAESTEADEKLIQQLSQEFAGGVWATIVSTLCRDAARPGWLAPANLLSESASAQTALQRRIAADNAHFEFTEVEWHEVMAESFSKLLASPLCIQDVLYLPKRWRMDAPELRHYLQRMDERSRHFHLLARADAVGLESWRRNLRNRIEDAEV